MEQINNNLLNFGQLNFRPPQNLEAEQALLGAILVNNKALENVSEFLKAEHFIHPIHSKIYATCCNMIERGLIVDTVTLKPLFIHDENIQDVGGIDYLAQLAGACIRIGSITDYGHAILEAYLRRQLIDIGMNTVREALNTNLSNSASDQMEKIEKSIYNLANENEKTGGPEVLSSALHRTLVSTEKAMNNPNALLGIPTDLTELDDLLGGLHDSDLIILAGRPGMGKSALATTIAFNAAQYFEKNNSTKKSVALFSLEMSAEQISARILASKANVSNGSMRKGKLDNKQFDKLAAAVDLLARVPLYVDETPGITVSMIKNRARRLKRDSKKGLGLIVIDYLQLISSNRKSENRVQELSEMTRALKIMAKELNVPVLVLSQLSRSVEQREIKRPLLSDLRESGSIEQDADIVMFVYREYYYLKDEQPQQRLNETAEKFLARVAEWENKKKELVNQAEVIVAKHRHGITKSIKLNFQGEFSRFSDLNAE